MFRLRGLLIRLGPTLHKGASDLLAIKLLLLHFQQDTIGCHDGRDWLVRSASGIAA